MEGEKDMGQWSNVSGPSGYMGGGSGLEAAALVAIADRRDDDKFIDTITANSVSDLRHDVAENRSDIRESIQTTTLHLAERLSDNEKASLEAKFEAKLETKEAVKDLSREIRCEIGRVEGCMQGFQNSVMEKFCALEQRELERENKALAQQVADLKGDSQTAILLKAIEALKPVPVVK